MRYDPDAGGTIYTAVPPYVPPQPPHYAPPDAVVGNAPYGGQYGGGVAPGPIPGYAPPSGPYSPPYTPPAPRTPPPGAPHITLKAGYTPDYNALIQNDPELVGARNNANRAELDAGTRRRSTLRDLFVRYGKVPATFNDQFGDIDQTTRDAAAHNQNSIFAQLADNYARSGEQFKRQLSARGALQSSDLDYGQDQLSRGYGQQQYDAGLQEADAATGAYNDYTGVLSQNARDLTSAIGHAETNVYSNPAYRPIEPTYADYDAEMSSGFGKPIYRGADGAWYNADGNPFDIVSGV